MRTVQRTQLARNTERYMRRVATYFHGFAQLLPETKAKVNRFIHLTKARPHRVVYRQGGVW